jgi:tRNA threonylcarbamoyladenosine biosynthesis protein TsaE
VIPHSSFIIKHFMSAPQEFLSTSEEATLAWARDFAARLKPGDVVALNGDLGAGKTVLSRGIAAALGFTGDVHSPSYALVHEYPGGRLPIFHMDLYRLAQASTGAAPDWHEIGLDHYFQQGGVCLIEWAERLPADGRFTWWVEITAEGENERRIRARLR